MMYNKTPNRTKHEKKKKEKKKKKEQRKTKTKKEKTPCKSVVKPYGECVCVCRGGEGGGERI